MPTDNKLEDSQTAIILEDNQAAIVMDDKGFHSMYLPEMEEDENVSPYPTQFILALAYLLKEDREFHDIVWSQWEDMLKKCGR